MSEARRSAYWSFNYNCMYRIDSILLHLLFITRMTSTKESSINALSPAIKGPVEMGYTFYQFSLINCR